MEGIGQRDHRQHTRRRHPGDGKLCLTAACPPSRARPHRGSRAQRATGEGLSEVLLQCIREHFGKPVHITSGYRTAAHNAAVGGSKSSQHLLGRAADFYVEGRAGGDCRRLR